MQIDCLTNNSKIFELINEPIIKPIQHSSTPPSSAYVL